MPSGIIHRPEVIFAIQPEYANRLAHQCLKFSLKFARQRDRAPRKYGDALPFRFKNPEEFASGLFKLLNAMRRF